MVQKAICCSRSIRVRTRPSCSAPKAIWLAKARLDLARSKHERAATLAGEPRDLEGGGGYARRADPPGGGGVQARRRRGRSRAARRRVHPDPLSGQRPREPQARHRRQPDQRRLRHAGHVADHDRLARSDPRLLRGRRARLSEVHPPGAERRAPELARRAEPSPDRLSPTRRAFRTRATWTSSTTSSTSGTGTILGRAVLPNPDLSLTPGLFARVRLHRAAARTRRSCCPTRRCGSDQAEKFVWVVDDKNQRPVSPHPRSAPLYDGLRVVREGLTADDRVDLAGIAAGASRHRRS